MKISLKTKTIIIIIAAFILLSIATLACYYRGVDNLVRDQYGQQANATARSIALSVDADKTKTLRDAVLDIYASIPEDQRISREQASDEEAYEAYLGRYDEITKMTEYNTLRTSIRKIKEQTEVYDVRLCCTDEDSGAVVYLADATTDLDFEAGPGSFSYIGDENKQVLEAPGLGFEPAMSNSDEFGWLMTTAAPLYDMNFHVIGFAEITIDMNAVIKEMRRSAGNMAIIVLLIMLTIGALVMILVENAMVRPINMLSDASVSYYSKDSDKSARRVKFSDLDIHTGDEIETLAKSMASMEKDIEDYISSLTETKDQLNTTREYAAEMDRIAYFDTMTGVRNMRAYEYSLEELRDHLEKGETEFGIAVVDLNDLKYYNDTFGHEKGDEAIKTVCRIICETFLRSPVFRYGGDEFTVILKGHDLKHVDGLIAAAKEKMQQLCDDESNPPWIRVRAAIGYAVFDPELDRDPDDVFKRADSAMYEEKKGMKRIGR